MFSISVVLPTYNRRVFLLEAIRSVVQQTLPVQEIIVVDDGSTDSSDIAVARFFPSVTYIKQQNAGPSAARNRGMQLAKGDFIALLDSDDLWPLNRLSLQIDMLRKQPHLEFLFGFEAKFVSDPESAEVLLDISLQEELRATQCPVSDPLGLLLRENVIPTSSVLLRRSALERIGLMDENLRQAEDYDWWLRFADAGVAFAVVPEALCLRRLHSGNLVNDWLNRTLSTVAVLTHHSSRARHSRDRLIRRIADLHYDLGSHYIRALDFERARVHLLQAAPSERWPFALPIKQLLCRCLARNRD